MQLQMLNKNFYNNLPVITANLSIKVKTHKWLYSALVNPITPENIINRNFNNGYVHRLKVPLVDRELDFENEEHGEIYLKSAEEEDSEAIEMPFPLY